MEMEATAESGGSFGEGSSGSGQLPGESIEDYIARLKKLGLYGGDITDQPLVGGGIMTPGTTSGAGAGAAGTSQGTTSGTGAGKAGTGQGTTSGLTGQPLSGKGMWEPDNSKSGPVGGAYSGGGGGGSYDPGTHKVNALASMMGSGSSGSGKSELGYVPGGVMTGSLVSNYRPNNFLEEILRYVKPTYTMPARPAPLSGQPGTNYLAQLMRSR